MRRTLFSTADPPHRLGRYELVSLLGSALQSEVFAAYDVRLHRNVALKLVRIEDDDDPVLEEARLLAGLSHPNVVTVFDAGVFSKADTKDLFDRAYLAMELVDGPTLRHWLDREPRHWREIVSVFLCAGHGLVAAHEAGICHGDFKPDNVLVSAAGIKLVDFGLARLTPRGRDRSLCAVAGTLAYMAPEQHRGEPATEVSDQYAFCVALWEALCGETAFDADSVDALLQAKERIDLPLQAKGKVPRRIRRCLERGLSPRPARRHPSVRALLRDLQRALRFRSAVALSAAGVAVAATAVAATAADKPACPDPQSLLSVVWGSDPRREVSQAFERSSVRGSQSIAKGTLGRIDAWADAWVAARADACQLPPQRSSQRGLCLDHQLIALSEVVDHLRSGDTRALRDGLSAAGALPRASLCIDPGPLEPAKVGDETAQALMRVTTLYDLGRYDDALRVAEQLAASVGPRSAAERTEVSLALGQARAKTGDTKGASEALRQAASAAETSENDARAAMALIRLAWVVGELQHDTQEATTLLTLAQGKVQRLGSAPALRAELETMLGHLAAHVDPAQALAHYQAALEHHRSAHGSDDRRVGESLVNVGVAHDEIGEPEKALEYFAEALEVWAPVLGPVHPLSASAIHGMGTTHLRRGRPGVAFVYLQAAFDQAAVSHGDDAITTHRYAADLGAAMAEVGAVAPGEAVMLRARSRLAELVGDEDEQVVRLRINLARLHLIRDEPAAAVDELIDHLDSIERGFPDNPVLSDAWALAAAIAFSQDEGARAVDFARRAVEQRRRLHREPASIAEAQVMLGQALYGQEPGRAVEIVREAHETLKRHGGAPRMINAAAAWLQSHSR